MAWCKEPIKWERFQAAVQEASGTHWRVSNAALANVRVPQNQRRFLGMGCDEALFSEKKGFSVKRGGGNSVNGGLVRISTGKAIQWRGPGHSVNCRTLKSEKLLCSSPSRKSAPTRVRQEKRSVRLSFGFGECRVGWGVFHAKGWASKS